MILSAIHCINCIDINSSVSVLGLSSAVNGIDEKCREFEVYSITVLSLLDIFSMMSLLMWIVELHAGNVLVAV